MLAELESALRADAEETIQEALKVSVCVSNGLSRVQTAERLNIPSVRVKGSVDRLRSAALRLGWHPEQF
jgi:hypothetical protein